MIKSQLSFDTLRAANVARDKLWDPFGKLDASFRGVEFAGEAGEVCNVIKKLERERLGLRGSRDTVAHLTEELADTIICADLIAMAYRIDLAHAVGWKFNATSEKMKLPVMIGAGNLVIEEKMS
jgi:NTP pyrophosphatase (non-canonical NTP hydrolase)